MILSSDLVGFRHAKYELSKNLFKIDKMAISLKGVLAMLELL